MSVNDDRRGTLISLQERYSLLPITDTSSSQPSSPSTTMTTGNGIIEDLDGPEGCYLIFESSHGGRLMLFYSRGPIPADAIGFW